MLPTLTHIFGAPLPHPYSVKKVTALMGLRKVRGSKVRRCHALAAESSQETS